MVIKQVSPPTAAQKPATKIFRCDVQIPDKYINASKELLDLSRKMRNLSKENPALTIFALHIKRTAKLLLTSGAAASRIHLNGSFKKNQTYIVYRTEALNIIKEYLGELILASDPKIEAVVKLVAVELSNLPGGSGMKNCVVICNDQNAIPVVRKAFNNIRMSNVVDIKEPSDFTRIDSNHYDVVVIFNPTPATNLIALGLGAEKIYGLVAIGTADERFAGEYVQKGKKEFEHISLL